MNSWQHAKKLDLQQSFTHPLSFDPTKDFLTLSRDLNAMYEDLYLCGLKNSDYNFILSDYSYFQFSTLEQGSCRFAFYPNPFIGAQSHSIEELSDLSEYLNEGIINFDQYLQNISEIRKTQHPPLTRYEYSPKQYTELVHPCSHFHFGHHSENRWPVQRKLSVGAFTLMILKHYYIHQWVSYNSHAESIGQKTLDETYAKEKTKSLLLSDLHFSTAEKTQFYWA